MDRPNVNSGNSGFRGYAKAYQIIAASMQFAVAVILMLFLGMWLDGKFDTSPWLMLTGLAVGFTAGFYSFLRSVRKLAKDSEDSQDRR